MPEPHEKVVLYFTHGTSDKEYHVHLVQEAEQYVVHTQNGRRGGTLRTTVKSKKPEDYEVAKKLFDKIVAEQLSKGYSFELSGARFAGSNEAFTGITPQLLNPVKQELVPGLLQNAEWVAQEKFDGCRRLTQSTVDAIKGINRRGLAVALPEAVTQALQRNFRQHMPLVLDGELVQGVLYVFDVLEHQGLNVRTFSLAKRLSLLESLFQGLEEPQLGSVRLSPTAYTTTDKKSLMESVKMAGKEGLVFKKLEAPYEEGRPNSGGTQLKLKFVHHASVLVGSHNDKKRSVSLKVFNQDGQQVVVGNVTIPVNEPMPEVGAIIEVEYLYAFEQGSLFQPVYKGVRDDLVARVSCNLEQLYTKPAHDLTDEEDLDA